MINLNCQSSLAHQNKEIYEFTRNSKSNDKRSFSQIPLLFSSCLFINILSKTMLSRLEILGLVLSINDIKLARWDEWISRKRWNSSNLREINCLLQLKIVCDKIQCRSDLMSLFQKYFMSSDTCSCLEIFSCSNAFSCYSQLKKEFINSLIIQNPIFRFLSLGAVEWFRLIVQESNAV